MFRRSAGVILTAGATVTALIVFASVWADRGGAQESREGANTAPILADLQRKEGEIDRATGRLVEVGAQLEESQGRLDRARARQKELGRRARKLTEDLVAQKKATAKTRSRLEEQIQVSYKGRDLEGLLLLVDGLFGGKQTQSSAITTRQMLLLLTDSSENIQRYEKEKYNLRSTLRQLEQSRAEYRESRREDWALVEELEGRESELLAAIEGLGFQRDRMEERIAELEAEARAGSLRRPPATAKRDTTAGVRDREEVPESGQSGSDEQGKVEEERAQDRERELEIAREEIVTQPVEPIPYEEYVRLYRESAERYGFGGDWYVLAAVGKIESNHGENMGPSGAGAMGPMQFLPSTWSSFGVDGNGDGEANIMDPEDAIPAAASYLKAGGAPDDWYAALFTYNRAGWYVEEVLAIAESYRRVHGDDSVGPYLEPAISPPPARIPPRPEPSPSEPDEAPEEEGSSPMEERPSGETTSPPAGELQPIEDVPDGVGETTFEPGGTAAEDGVAAGQYKD